MNDMTPLIAKYISQKKIEQISLEKKFDKPNHEEFIWFLDYTLEQDDRLGFDELDHEKYTLEYVCEYIDAFIAEKRKGFSEIWAREYTLIRLFEENLNPPAIACSKLLKINQEQGIKDLELYCQLTNRDELFIKHFLHLLKVDVPNTSPSVEFKADSYSLIFKQQIKNGKSELFANKYADLMAEEDDSELSCYTEAIEFEKAIESGYSLEYATVFSFHIAGYIANFYSSYQDSIGDELVEIERKNLEKEYHHLK